jgi:hypothetical protein
VNGSRALRISAAAFDGESTPQVRLLDARVSGLDESGLALTARALSGATGTRCVSRSYCFPLALVAWHAAPVGIDIERITPFDNAFAESIRTPTERATVTPAEDEDRHVCSLWSSKEALAKALGNALQYDPRRLESPIAWPNGRSDPWRATTLAAAPGYVAWLCWRRCD